MFPFSILPIAGGAAVLLACHFLRQRYRGRPLTETPSQALKADLKLAETGIHKAHEVLKKFQSYERNDRLKNLDSAERELRSYKSLAAEGGRYSVLRHSMDNVLWWVGNSLIQDEPEFVHDLLGNRPLLKQIFNRWDSSMSWSSSPARYSVHERLRHKRLELYRLIKRGKHLYGDAPDNHLQAAERHLKKEDFEGDFEETKLKMQLLYVEEGIQRANISIGQREYELKRRLAN